MTRDQKRTEAISALGGDFAEYLRVQTESNIASPDSVTKESLQAAVENLDVALNQIMDFAGIYGSDPRLDIEPLALPAAALCGEYLRNAFGSSWIPDGDGEGEALIMQFSESKRIDLLSVVRANLFSGMSNLGTMVAHLRDEETTPS